MSALYPHKLTVQLSKQQFAQLQRETSRNHEPLSVAIRRRAFQDGPERIKLPYGSRVHSDAVEAAARASSGLPRTQLESIVAAVVLSLNQAQTA